MNITKTSSLWVSFIGALAVLALMSVLVQTTRRSSGMSASATNPTDMTVMMPAGSPSPFVTNTPEMESTEGPAEDWSATETAWIATQSAFRATLQYDQTHQPTSVEPTLISGIINGVGSIWSDTPYELENSWQNQVNGQQLGVLAGAYRADPMQGIVVMGWEEVYETPFKAGSLHIIEEQNYRLTLMSTYGMIFYFDIPGRRFVESLTDVVPTIAPITPSPTRPSPTPTVTPTFNPTWLTPWPTCTPIPPSNATAGPCGP